MSTLSYGTMTIRGTAIEAASIWPPLRNVLDFRIATELDEDDGLFIGYGLLPNQLPYTMQDVYDGPETELHFPNAVLENEWLRAEFLPTLGGRLWRLYDKGAGRELLHVNPVFKPGNFAIRNAWVAGGVEWNCGRRGHDANTASPVFQAELALPDGTPVLRLYDFNRDRAVTYQMDFFLPDGSKFLFGRMRIVNPNERTVPMYWWSNIAVEEHPGQRIVVPAHTSFANSYVNDSHHALCKVPLPCHQNMDCTRPENYRTSKDHFFNIPEGERKFEASIYADGYGLIQCSTDRLRGRKLFVWGRGPGGRHWQRRLTSPEGADYLEIQAGLGRTQMECVPMPPRTAWEWLEAYGAIQVAPEQVHGDWDRAIETVRESLETALPRRRLEEMLTDTRETLGKAVGKLRASGSGWGALDRQMRKKRQLPPLPEYLDFGDSAADAATEEFRRLLATGSFGERDPELPPAGFMVQDEWFELLKTAAAGVDRDHYYTHYQLGLNFYQRGDFEQAEAAWTRSLALCDTVWARHALANLYRVTGRLEEGARELLALTERRREDVSLLKEALKTASEAGLYREMAALYEKLPETMRRVGMVRFFYAEALAHTGKAAEAERILLGPPALSVPDIREGENSLSGLYLFIMEARARAEGRPWDPEQCPIPAAVDLRMS